MCAVQQGKFIGCDEEGNFYKGIIVFMIQGLKNSVLVVVRGCPITALNVPPMKWRVAFLPYPI